jgi:hypothetical protein
VSAPYRPGQPQWPANGPQRPERPPPSQYRQEEPPPAPANKALRWALQIAGLVSVAVISGLIWYFFTDNSSSTTTDDGQEPTTPPVEGVYQFTAHEKMPSPNTDSDCAKHAYGQIQTFLKNTPCDHLTRQLFVTDVAEGRTVYTSVSVVTMPDEEKAAALRDLTDQDGSGNVSDVVRDGVVKIDGLDRLSGGEGYASNQSGRDVVIVESDLAPKDESGDKAADEKLLDRVSTDALRLGPEIDTGSGTG